MTNNQQKRYETPRAEIIEIETQGVLCMSAGGAGNTGTGTDNMQTGGTYGW